MSAALTAGANEKVWRNGIRARHEALWHRLVAEAENTDHCGAVRDLLTEAAAALHGPRP